MESSSSIAQARGSAVLPGSQAQLVHQAQWVPQELPVRKALQDQLDRKAPQVHKAHQGLRSIPARSVLAEWLVMNAQTPAELLASAPTLVVAVLRSWRPLVRIVPSQRIQVVAS